MSSFDFFKTEKEEGRRKEEKRTNEKGNKNKTEEHLQFF
jgi:hypothetical protein